jgi:hypothetical protein
MDGATTYIQEWGERALLQMHPISFNVCGFLIMLINCRLNPISYLLHLRRVGADPTEFTSLTDG